MLNERGPIRASTTRNLIMTKLFVATLAAASLLTLKPSSTLADGTNNLRIYTAMEVEYPTEIGKSYILQGAVGLTNWVDIGKPVLGNGQTVDRVFSTKDGSVDFASYRLLIAPGPTNGFAPWLLDGIQLQMDDSTSSSVVHFLTSTNGQDVYLSGNDDFSFHYSRTTAHEGQVERSYSPARRDTVSYNFTAAGSGSWVREEFEQNVLKNRKIGSFHYLSYDTNNVGTNLLPVITATLPPAPPNSLTGLVCYTFTGPSPDKYQFDVGTSGVATPGSSSGEVETTSTGNIFTYSYSVISSNTASLTINFGYYGIGGDKQEYDLTFNDGSNALFTRRIYRLGSLFTTDNGVFTQNAVLPSTSTGNTNSVPTVAPTNPVGFTYTMNYSSTPPRLVFKNSVGGIQFDDSAPSDFTYTYAAAGTDTFHIVVTFKPGKWDEYDLTFTTGATGSIVVRRYEKSALKRTDAGSFSVAATGN